MGKGTIGFNKAPKHRKIYGGSEFYIRPIFKTRINNEDVYFFALRPSQTEGCLVDLEGEWSTGRNSYLNECRDINNGEYAICLYLYYHEELEKATPEQRKLILEWATDGAL